MTVTVKSDSANLQAYRCAQATLDYTRVNDPAWGERFEVLLQASKELTPDDRAELRRAHLDHIADKLMTAAQDCEKKQPTRSLQIAELAQKIRDMDPDQAFSGMLGGFSTYKNLSPSEAKLFTDVMFADVQLPTHSQTLNGLMNSAGIRAIHDMNMDAIRNIGR